MSSDEIHSSLEAIRATLEKLDDKFTEALENQNDTFKGALENHNNKFQRQIDRVESIDARLKFLERTFKKSSTIRDHSKNDADSSRRGANNNCSSDPPAVQNPTFERDEDIVETTTSDGKMIASIFSIYWK